MCLTFDRAGNMLERPPCEKGRKTVVVVRRLMNDRESEDVY